MIGKSWATYSISMHAHRYKGMENPVAITFTGQTAFILTVKNTLTLMLHLSLTVFPIFILTTNYMNIKLFSDIYQQCLGQQKLRSSWISGIVDIKMSICLMKTNLERRWAVSIFLGIMRIILAIKTWTLLVVKVKVNSYHKILISVDTWKRNYDLYCWISVWSHIRLLLLYLFMFNFIVTINVRFISTQADLTWPNYY